MITISLCMIVKNEADTLARCLDSAKEIADEIIIADTGSTDQTKEIAAAYTDRIYDFKWIGDFSAARNFAFSKGTKDYLLWLDADDVILEEDRARFLTLKQTLDPAVDIVMMPYHAGFDESGRPVFSFFRERMIKRGPNAVWRGRIHEVIPPFGTVIKKEITIEHHKLKTSDAGRNLRILKEMQRTEGLGTRDQYYYGKELYYHKQYREAERALAEFLKRPDGWREDQVDACRHRAYCLYGLSEEEEALVASLLLQLLEGGQIVRPVRILYTRQYIAIVACQHLGLLSGRNPDLHQPAAFTAHELQVTLGNAQSLYFIVGQFRYINQLAHRILERQIHSAHRQFPYGGVRYPR